MKSTQNKKINQVKETTRWSKLIVSWEKKENP